MKTKTANVLKTVIQTSEEVDAKASADKKLSFSEGATQDDIPLRTIKDGIMITRDGRYLGVIEILPCIYYLKPPEVQRSILQAFSQIFFLKHRKWSLKILSDIGDCSDLIDNVFSIAKSKTNLSESMAENVNNYTRYVRSLVSEGSSVRRYFYIWEYSRDDEKTYDETEIITIMQEQRDALDSRLSSNSDGNIVVRPEDNDLFTYKFLYYFFNRLSCHKESFEKRKERITNDFKLFTQSAGIDKKVCATDFIAPKGMYFMNRKYHTMDGLFYGYIGIDGDSWPLEVSTGWLDSFNFGSMCDITLTGQMLPSETTALLLDQYNNLNKGSVNSLLYKGKEDKAIRKKNTLDNVKDIRDQIRSGNPLQNCMIFITIRASSFSLLKRYMRIIRSALKNAHINSIDSFLNIESFFTLYMPFLYGNRLANQLHHNVLSSNIGSIYPLNTATIYDSSGIVLGTTGTSQNSNDNHDVIAINNFNTSMYENGNITILGTPGAGKTYTEQVLGNRFSMINVRNFFIIPKKGYQYKSGCDLCDGLYIPLMPGSPYCINIMEIRPEGDIDLAKIKDRNLISSQSLRAKKINNIICWIQLQMGGETLRINENNRLNVLLTRLYDSYGITDDNLSIYSNPMTGSLKVMPIIGEVYELTLHDNVLKERISEILSPWVNGNCSNMNGQTNVNLDNNYIVFDIDEDNIGEKLLPAYLYIAFQHVYSEIKANVATDLTRDPNRCYRSIVFLDEVWKMMRTETCAEQVEQMVKLIRGYGGATVIATQELKDLLEGPNKVYGQSIINCSALALLLKMKPLDLQRIQSVYMLSPKDCQTISSFRTGHGMLISNGDKILVNISSMPEEDAAFRDRTRVS